MGEAWVNGGVGTTSTCPECLPVMVKVAAQGFANEISWQIIGADVYGPYTDYSNNTHELCLHQGEHQISFFDVNDDGWHGGTIEVFGANANVDPITVSGSGDAVFFWVEWPCVPATVNVQATSSAHQVTWHLDGGSTFGPYSYYEDAHVDFCLSVDQHQLSYFDSYGNGWSGGWIEVVGADDTTLVPRTYVEGYVSRFVPAHCTMPAAAMPPACVLERD
jgi:hypothetical protein